VANPLSKMLTILPHPKGWLEITGTGKTRLSIGKVHRFDAKTLKLFWILSMPKRISAAQPVTEKLKRNQSLAPLLARLELHQKLLTALQRQLPETMRSHCLACVLDTKGQLSLYVDTSAWASQLRFHQLSILPALKKIALVERLRVRILLPVTPVERKATPPRIPNREILAQLEHNAEAVEDPKIRRALQRMVHAMRKQREAD